MPCYSPLTGYRSRFLTKNGKRAITFNRNAGLVDLPVTVPCGMCIGCRIDRSRQWAIRCVHEAKLHTRNCFITLTYAPEKLPITNSLVRDDLQKFFKRARKKIGKFRYFACGEYGDQQQRPHYHAILFGVDFASDRKKHSTNKRGDTLYVSQTLTELWGLGHCTIGQFNYSTASYTARYVFKKQLGRDSRNRDEYSRTNLTTGELFQVDPEFALMSLKPGIGHGWYEKFKVDAFPSDFLIHDGKKHPVPRYYFNKLEKEEPTTHAAIKIKRQKAREEHAENSSPDRLYVREQCKLSQISTLKRSL